MKGILLLAVLLMAAGMELYALNALERTRGSDAVTASNPLLMTATAAPRLLAPAVASTASTNLVGPRIQFATPVHDLGKLKGGEVVNYTYVFTNLGDRLLEVTSVQASCGCTTAGEWTRQTEPGKNGAIPIQFNSRKFSGQIEKSITVTCNDAKQPTVVLQLKASIWKAIDITPQLATLNVTSESPSNTTTVRIVSHEEAPLTLSAPESNNRAFAAELRTNLPGKEFQLIIKAVPPLPARSVSGVISLKTSSTNLPVLYINTWANVQQTVMVMPSLITLPAAPLAKPMPYTISIRNNGTNALALSEPAVNAQGVDVQLKELQPGRYSTLTVSFPAGFEIAPGETVELRVRSNHPQFPTIRVPVRQPPRLAPTAVPAPDQVGQPPLPPRAGGD